VDVNSRDQPERVVWQRYPSWKHFTWLYFFAAWTALRGLILERMEVPGWEMWFLGAACLIGVVAALRYWVRYIVTSQRVSFKNGYTGSEIENMPIERIRSVEIQQGPIAGLMGVRTVVIQERDSNRTIRIRGISDAEVVVEKIKALAPSILETQPETPYE
jgi:membrane protein YdbS with pleckstrin-like domain